jgi:hypothetical protein
MRTLQIGRWVGLVGLLFLGSAPVLSDPPATDARVEVRVVKYPGLQETVKQLRGKVIVVDCWADT